MQAQITLQPYDEPGKSGTKSIVFEYEETDPNNRNAAPKKVKKEFDIQEGNPFNKLGYMQKGEGKFGNKVYGLSKNDIARIKSDFNLRDEFRISESAYLTSFHQVKTQGDFATISYMSIIKSEGDIVEEARSSSILILDKKGKEFFRLDNLPHDVFSLVISGNGKYVAFASGEHLEHSTFSSEPMIHIYNTDNKTIYYQENAEPTIIGFLHQTISIGVFCDEGRKSIFLDQNNGYMYEKLIESEGSLFMKGYNEFIYRNDQELTFSDFTKIK
ncbi:MAG: hypothetical protein ABJZ80_12690 [Gilvibacter sp.]